MYSIWILTSLAFGGATSTSSILRGSPAPQQTAALHLMVVPAVDDIEGGGEGQKLESMPDRLWSRYYRQVRYFKVLRFSAIVRIASDCTKVPFPKKMSGS